MRALLYAADTSARRDVEALLLPTGVLQLRDGTDIASWKLAEIKVEPRIPGRPAVVELPDGGRLEIADAEAFYRRLPERPSGWVHALERHWGLALTCAAASVALIAWSIFYGIPIAARVAADLMPTNIHGLIGRESMDAMDRFLFEPTALEPERQAELTALFEGVVATVGDDADYRLELRKSEEIGPNAFALPSGIVVMTDALIRLADDDGEIAAVLAHEVGHVVHHHAMRRLIQSSVTAGLVIAVTGDVGSAANLAAGLPTVLLDASYSRDFEREADEVAFDYLDARGISREELGELLVRIDEEAGRNPGRATLLDSHPASRERLAAPRERE